MYETNTLVSEMTLSLRLIVVSTHMSGEANMRDEIGLMFAE